MNSRHRSVFPSRRPLPTISEAPTGQPSTSPSTSQNVGTGSSSYSSKPSSTFQKLSRPPITSSATYAPGLKPATIKPRTSKTSQKHVALPTAAQDAPLPSILDALDLRVDVNVGELLEDSEDLSSEGQYDEQGDARVRRGRKTRERANGASGANDAFWKRTVGEQLTPEQRDENGYQRLTAYYCCEEFKMSLLSGFLKREHAVSPRYVSLIAGVTKTDCTGRLYDDAIYALYHLPLLPGYQPNVNIRSCITDKAAQAKLVLSLITEAEESGYHDAYFPASTM